MIHGFIKLTDLSGNGFSKNIDVLVLVKNKPTLINIIKKESYSDDITIKNVLTGVKSTIKKIDVRLIYVRSYEYGMIHIDTMPNFNIIDHIGDAVSFDDRYKIGAPADQMQISGTDVLEMNSVKQYTQFANYSVDVPLLSFNDNIERHVRKGLQLNPDFQRGHVWNEKQQVRFIEHILRGGSVPPIYLNQAGWMSDWKGDFTCVDGLQRITAIQKFLSGELRVFGNNTINTISGINSSITINIKVNNLKTRKEVLTWYYELNANMVAHTEEELARIERLIENEKS